ncbi:MAG: Ni/Fe hydrogenase subunit alpha [Actinomycetia bacterium]|nr:Ni/Fe hydrogenase subunit alpha [Actinomycetes bacterium]MCP4962154.1 Ni/Fe hydrogenase subunit alpha [Actinomycetes bacterium]
MHVRIEDGHVVDVQLNIYEPPRFFEGFLRGRRYTEPPDITARICGICPVAYQMSACAAIEDAIGVTVDGPLLDLRRLLYCGEWIESHTLHIHMLHAPDFLGYDSAIDLAKDHRDVVERGLKIKKIGNEILEVLGGRAIHPINVQVGGFYKTPTRRELLDLRTKLEVGLELSVQVVELVSGFDFPHLESPHELVSADDGDRYPILGSRVVSDRGLDIPVAEFLDHIAEEHVEHSTALHAHIIERGNYLVGPLARYALRGELLAPAAREVARAVGLEPVCRNPFRSIIVRAVEVVHAFATAIDIIDRYEAPERPAVPVAPRAGIGHGVTEAPRGLLYHRYEIDEGGTVLSAVITPPTSQSQASIEHDLFHYVEDNIDMPDDELRRRAEVTIRNHDPCISCATHFLDLTVDRR